MLILSRLQAVDVSTVHLDVVRITQPWPGMNREIVDVNSRNSDVVSMGILLRLNRITRIVHVTLLSSDAVRMEYRFLKEVTWKVCFFVFNALIFQKHDYLICQGFSQDVDADTVNLDVVKTVERTEKVKQTNAHVRLHFSAAVLTASLKPVEKTLRAAKTFLFFLEVLDWSFATMTISSTHLYAKICKMCIIL